MIDPFTPSFWDQQYREGRTPWDIGYANPFWIDYVATYPPSVRILFPGAGRAHEALALHKMGYTNCWICDWSQAAMEKVREGAPDFPGDQLLTRDFFDLQEGFDLVVEQTFFSALPPRLRGRYARKMHALLTPGGRYAALLFASEMNRDRPPFGGSETAYRAIFEPYFKTLQFHLSDRSIRPRLGNEFFLELAPR